VSLPVVLSPLVQRGRRRHRAKGGVFAFAPTTACLGGVRQCSRKNPRRAVPLGDLATGEFVLFTSYISCGLALPISPLFLLLLEEFRLQLQHLTPHSVL
jgi:hypothetical protein